MNIREIVESYKDEIIEKTRELVSYESVQSPSEKNYPFGKTVADCLHSALNMCDEYGFKTVNLDNYVGYAEIGEGKKLIGVLGHLDVVPLGTGWTHDPLGGEIVDGVMYGRGTSDDKGPVVCAMVALKIVKELRPELNKRIRLIMGCNEETGSRCLKYYVDKEGHIDYGFTPDGPFPGCFGEKGHLRLKIIGKTKLVRFVAGVAANVVPNCCEFEVEKNSFDENKFAEYLKSQDIRFEKTVNEVNGNWIYKVFGVAAHASLPELGKNAISYAMMALETAGYEDELVHFYASCIGLTTDGSLFGCACHDEYGALTFNVGIADTYEPGTVYFIVDSRFPVSMKSSKVCDLIVTGEVNSNVRVEILHRSEPLFFEPTSPLVTMLKEAYQEVTGTNDEPVTMGGGTYAQGIHNCIAFGGEFPGIDVHMHDADEFIRVDHMLLQTEIYVNALLKLLDYEG